MPLDRVRQRGSNVTDTTRAEALEACTATYRLLEEAADAAKQARSEHAAELRRWKKLGVNTDALRLAIRDRFTAEDDTLAQVHEYVRFRALQNMPNIQQSLLDLWAPIDLPEDRKAAIERQRWHDDGAFSGRQGQPRDANPHPAGSEAHQAWDRGWLEDQERIAGAMGRGETPQPAATH